VIGRIATLLVVGACLVLPANAVAATWTVSTTVTNATGTGTSNCPSSAPGTNCIFATGATISAEGVWQSMPWNAIAAANGWSGQNTWVYTAPHLGYGADAYMTYTMPDGMPVKTQVTDDVNQGPEQGYWSTASCSVPAGQAINYECVPNNNGANGFGTSAESFAPSLTFAPVGTASQRAAGAQCTAGATSYPTIVPCTGSDFSPLLNGDVILLLNTGAQSVNLVTYNTGSLLPTTTQATIAPGQTYQFVESSPGGDQLQLQPAQGTPAAPMSMELLAVASTPPGVGPASGSWTNGVKQAFWNWLLSGGDDDGGDAALGVSAAAVAPPDLAVLAMAQAAGVPVPKAKPTQPKVKPKKHKVKPRKHKKHHG
jgi:hypothetical protein